MDDEKSAPIGRAMDCILLQGNTSVIALETADKLVMISDDIDDFSALAPFAQELLNYVVMGLGPKNSTTKCPNINQIPYEIELLELGVPKKFKESGRITATSSKVNVRYPTRTVVFCACLHGDEDYIAVQPPYSNRAIVTFLQHLHEKRWKWGSKI